MTTLAVLEERYQVEILEHLARDIEVPTVKLAACQGDVSILRVTTREASTPIPKQGVAVVRGENGGNTHSLHGDGFFDAAELFGSSVTLGTLTVPTGGEVFLLHPEHGGMAVAPGTYRVGRQREQMDEIRMVQD